jgi:transcriptional regulator with XRE-family HTH domain
MAPVCKPPHNRGRTFILEWRKASHMTQKQIAEALHVEQPTISRLERGKFPYEQDFLERLAALFKATPADLISRHPGERIATSDRTRFNEALVYATVDLVRADMRDRDLQTLVALAVEGAERRLNLSQPASRPQAPLPTRQDALKAPRK